MTGPTNGGVWVISGPTAVGKGTVVKELAKRHPQVFVSVSATTRAPRAGEVDGRDYLFVSDDEFDSMIERGELLEWALVHASAKYGTPRTPVVEQAASGRPVILEVDVQGAEQVLATMPEATRIFLAPPSWDELVSRLSGRGTETPQQQARRLETAKWELEHLGLFDHVVVNNQIGECVDTLVGLLGLHGSI